MTVSVKPGMKDQTSSDLPRAGAAKRPQTSFPVHPGMKSQVDFRGAAPANPGEGPLANPDSPTDGGSRKIVATEFKPSWGMRDANGNSVNGEQGKKVLSEGSL